MYMEYEDIDDMDGLAPREFVVPGHPELFDYDEAGDFPFDAYQPWDATEEDDFEDLDIDEFSLFDDIDLLDEEDEPLYWDEDLE